VTFYCQSNRALNFENVCQAAGRDAISKFLSDNCGGGGWIDGGELSCKLPSQIPSSKSNSTHAQIKPENLPTVSDGGTQAQAQSQTHRHRHRHRHGHRHRHRHTDTGTGTGTDILAQTRRRTDTCTKAQTGTDSTQQTHDERGRESDREGRESGKTGK
jgi:hypothetical protein